MNLLGRSAVMVLAGGLLHQAHAQTLSVSADVAHGQPVTATLHLAQAVDGTAVVRLRWTDGLNRVVEDRRWAIDLTGRDRVDLVIDSALAVTALNRLDVRLERSCGTCPGRLQQASTTFVVPPWDDGWSDFEILMWQPQTPAAYRTLRSIGVSGGRMIAKDQPIPLSEGQGAALLEQDLRWYEENIATDFYSPYHRWTPGKPVNWKYLEAKAALADAPDSMAPLMRDPSLSDATQLLAIRQRLGRVVAAQRKFRPLYFTLGDETGIADLAAYWDFDFSLPSLSAFRAAMAVQYGSLQELNRQWGSRFDSWSAVMPLTARQAIERTDGNFSAWADFRAWMDRSFADALAQGRDAVHAADPKALAAIEGGQIPGWGGYDYDLLSQAVDVLEIYDAGNSLEITHSLNPALPLLTTSFESGAKENWRVWRELLRGSRGLILWDETSDFARPDGTLGPRGQVSADTFREIRGGLGALLGGATAPAAPIAIHYSPASMRAAWIEDRVRDGAAGLELASHPDHPNDAFLRLRESFVDLFNQQALQYRFLSTRLIESGSLDTAAPKVLVLPQSSALSDQEVVAIRRFVAAGGRLIVAGRPGRLDGHVRQRDAGPLDDLLAGQTGVYSLSPQEILAGDHATGERLRRWLEEAGAGQRFAVTEGGAPADNVAETILRLGDIDVVGLLPSVADGSGPRRTVHLDFGEPRTVYDLRAGKSLGRLSDVDLDLEATSPRILALARQGIARADLAVTPVAKTGTGVDLTIARSTETTTPTVYRIAVADPEGHPVAWLSGHQLAVHGRLQRRLPLAVNEQTGRWSVKVTDILTGQVMAGTFLVR
jgi:hypothetical protein